MTLAGACPPDPASRSTAADRGCGVAAKEVPASRAGAVVQLETSTVSSVVGPTSTVGAKAVRRRLDPGATVGVMTVEHPSGAIRDQVAGPIHERIRPPTLPSVVAGVDRCRLGARCRRNVPGHQPAGAVRSLSSISQAWSIVWNALWRMRNGRFHDRIRLPSPVLYARMVAT